MGKLASNPIKSSIILIITAILASIAHNIVYAVAKVEEPFFFTIALVSAASIPVVLVIYLIQKFTSTKGS